MKKILSLEDTRNFFFFVNLNLEFITSFFKISLKKMNFIFSKKKRFGGATAIVAANRHPKITACISVYISFHKFFFLFNLILNLL